MAKKKPSTVKAHCPTCDGERTCEVHGTVTKTWQWEDKSGSHSANGGFLHSLIECRGCETVFYESQSWNSEDIDYYYDAVGETQSEYNIEKATYPKPDSKAKPLWLEKLSDIDAQLYRILHQVYVAHDNDAHILTAIGLRTALDRGTEVLKIDPAKTFDEKLNDLQNGGWIGQTERDILGVVTYAGNAAAHRSWEPDGRDISKLLSALEVFLHRAFIVGQSALSIRSNIPPKPKRLPAPKPQASAS